MTPEREQEILAMVALGVGEPWRSVVVELLEERDKAQLYDEQLKDRIARGNAASQRREEELAARAARAEAQLAALREAVLTTHAVESEREHDEGIHSCHDRCSRPACVMRRERDEARAEVERLRREYECAECQYMRRERDEARAQLAALREAALEHDAAEADRTKALRMSEHGDRYDPAWWNGALDRAVVAFDRYTRALTDTAPAAEAHDRRVRAEALREAAACALGAAAATAEAHDRRVRAEALREAAACTVDGLRLWGRKAQGDASEWLRARADEIEEGR